MPIKVNYACPTCKLLGASSEEKCDVYPMKNLEYKKKKKGGLYTKFKVGICKGCGMLYTYEVVDKIPEEEGLTEVDDD